MFLFSSKTLIRINLPIFVLVVLVVNVISSFARRLRPPYEISHLRHNGEGRYLFENSEGTVVNCYWLASRITVNIYKVFAIICPIPPSDHFCENSHWLILSVSTIHLYLRK